MHITRYYLYHLLVSSFWITSHFLKKKLFWFIYLEKSIWNGKIHVITPTSSCVCVLCRHDLARMLDDTQHDREAACWSLVAQARRHEPEPQCRRSNSGSWHARHDRWMRCRAEQEMEKEEREECEAHRTWSESPTNILLFIQVVCLWLGACAWIVWLGVV